MRNLLSKNNWDSGSPVVEWGVFLCASKNLPNLRFMDFTSVSLFIAFLKLPTTHSFFFFFFFHVTLFPLFTDSYVKQTHIQLGEFFITFVPSLRSKRSQSSLFFFFN